MKDDLAKKDHSWHWFIGIVVVVVLVIGAYKGEQKPSTAQRNHAGALLHQQCIDSWTTNNPSVTNNNFSNLYHEAWIECEGAGNKAYDGQ